MAAGVHVDDPYAVLGVAPSATQAEIKAAYQTMVGKYHPDRHQRNPLEDLAQQRMVEINIAYELLSDPVRRSAYDAGSDAFASGHERRTPPAAGGWRVTRVVLAILAMIALPLAFRLLVMLVRGLRMLLARLFEAVGAIGGGRLAALVVIAGVAVLVVAWRKRRARKIGHAAPPPP